MTPADGGSPKESIARIEELVRRIESLPDPSARRAAVDLVQAVMGLHEAALARMLEVVAAAGNGAATMEAMAADDLISSVLCLHGVHPDDVETRLRRAIDKLHRYFDSRGAGIVLLEFNPELVRVRYTGTRAGSGAAAKQVIEETIYEAAPEIVNLVIEGTEERDPGFVPLANLMASQPA